MSNYAGVGVYTHPYGKRSTGNHFTFVIDTDCWLRLSRRPLILVCIYAALTLRLDVYWILRLPECFIKRCDLYLIYSIVIVSAIYYDSKYVIVQNKAAIYVDL